MAGALPVTNSELIANRSTLGKSTSRAAQSLPRIKVRSTSMRTGRTGADSLATLETEQAIVEPFRLPTSVNEHFCRIRSADRASTSRNALSPGN